MTAKLIAEEGALEGLVLSFDDGEEWVIGRDPDTCQLLVEDPAVSREHLVARRMPDGIAVENLSTTNPALVNDEAVDGSRVLVHGDTVKIGNGIFRYYTEIGGHKMDAAAQQGANNDEPDDEVYEEQDLSNEQMLAEIDFNVAGTGRWMLKVIAGPNNGAEFSMEPGHSYILGTNPEASDIVLHDGTVSRQHAKLTISADNKVTLQDLKSRNGVFLDDKQIKVKADLVSNSVVSLGTTRFIIFDREADRSTIITPLMPSIVKSLKDDEIKKGKAPVKSKAKEKEPVKSAPVVAKKSGFVGKMMLLLLIGGMVMIIGMATTSLFRTQEVVAPQIDTKAELQKVMALAPGVNYNFNDNNGSLLLIGHVLKSVDKARLLYDLQNLQFVREINDKNLVIDELVLQNINQVIGKNPQWRGVTLMAPSAGRFVLNGYLSSREQAEKLSDYMAQNFPYLDLLEKRVFVEEDEIQSIRVLLQEQGFKDVTVQMSSGELTLSGSMLAGRASQLEKLIATFKKDAAVRSVKNFVVELEPENSLVDLTESYKVTGSTNRGNTTVNVVINGRILSPGDTLDGMSITSIKRDAIFLEREGVKYKIEYNK
ncbi:MAG: type III secretion system inner membrane ring subunit SctD [Chlamydiales bacterium]|nr:type III secretion system inner membrane ring subunit SctD [Chlamydiales bacterium]